jgi:chaperonin GroEL
MPTRRSLLKVAARKPEITGRVEQIRREIEGTDSEYDREKLQERLAKLAGGVAQINVGAATETEMKERKDLIDDALAATRAAIEEGYRAWWWRRSAALCICTGWTVAEERRRVGVELVRGVLEMPLRMIAENAGLDGAVVANRVKKEKKVSYGYDALNDKYGDMLCFRRD